MAHWQEQPIYVHMELIYVWRNLPCWRDPKQFPIRWCRLPTSSSCEGPQPYPWLRLRGRLAWNREHVGGSCGCFRILLPSLGCGGRFLGELETIPIERAIPCFLLVPKQLQLLRGQLGVHPFRLPSVCGPFRFRGCCGHLHRFGRASPWLHQPSSCFHDGRLPIVLDLLRRHPWDGTIR